MKTAVRMKHLHIRIFTKNKEVTKMLQGSSEENGIARNSLVVVKDLLYYFHCLKVVVDNHPF